MSPFGGDFPAEKFTRTPVSTIKWVLDQIDDKEKADANIKAVTTAQLAQIVLQVAHGFSGSKKAAPKIATKEFLPFPEWKPRGLENQTASEPTKFILSQLVSKGEIPLEVYLALTAER